MDALLNILYALGFLYLLVWAIKAIIRTATNLPTWSGIIISAILGMLPLYLILCYFGIMGEKRIKSINDIQSSTATYAEKMSRQYDYDSSSKNIGWIKYAVLVFVVMFSFHFLSNDSDSKEQEDITLTESITTDNVISEEQIEETPVLVKKKAPYHKQDKKKKSSTSDKRTPLVAEKQNLEIESPKRPKIIISQEDYIDIKSNEKQKSALELLEEDNHANVVKQAKEAGLSTEGSTLDILERIHHANVIKQAKEAGVSTEGSTLDILERIHHANVVKQAKEAGVSTEGSTLDILERIHHANVVKQAKEAGVSTEGSTLDILERIQCKTLKNNGLSQ